MPNLRLTTLLLGSLALPAVAFNDLEQMPEAWCVTYLSTYLVPISAATSSPAESQLTGVEPSMSSDILVTLNPSSLISPEETFVETAPPSATTGPSTDTELIVLRIVPDTPDDGRLRKRDLGGFVGSPAEICNNADTFRLVDSQLLAVNGPVYFNGEDYKLFGPEQGNVPEGAITRTFLRDGDILRFQSSRIVPNGEAGFCQTPSDGQVYITFSSQPAGCIPVSLVVVGAQDCQDGSLTSTAITTRQAQQPSSVSSLGPIIVVPSSSEKAPPPVPTRSAETELPVVTTRPDEARTSDNPIIVPKPSTTFRFSNISSSQPPPETFVSSIPFTTFIFTSDSNTLVETAASTEAVEPEPSTTEGLTLTEEASTTADETTTETSTVETTVNTTTEESTLLSTAQATTKDTTTAKESTTFSTAQETTTTQEETTETTTAEKMDTTTEEQTTDNPTTTTFTSALDSTTETTTEAATTTTAESLEIVCPSNPQQCIRTFQIQCDTVIGGIPLTSGSSTLEQCSQACFDDPNCVIFTHSGTQCFSTSDSSNNQGSFAFQGWVSGIRGTC